MTQNVLPKRVHCSAQNGSLIVKAIATRTTMSTVQLQPTHFFSLYPVYLYFSKVLKKKKRVKEMVDLLAQKKQIVDGG